MKLPRDLSGAGVVGTLERFGFAVVRQTGSHAQLRKGKVRVTVPLHRSGVSNSDLVDSELKWQQSNRFG